MDDPYFEEELRREAAAERRKHIKKVPKWSSDWQYSMSLLCWACGIESAMNSFILGSKSTFSGLILIICLLQTICVGIPYTCLEISIGQYSGRGAVGIWDCCPILKGIGHCSILSIIIRKILTNLICCYTLLYTVNSVMAEIPWYECDKSWADDNCAILNITTILNPTELDCKKGKVCKKVSTEEYYRNYIQNEHSKSPYIPNPMLIGCCFVTALGTYIANHRGVKSIEKVTTVLVLVPLVEEIILVVLTSLDRGCYTGLSYLFVANGTKGFVDYTLWGEIFENIVVTLGFGLGGLSALGSQSAFRKPVYMRSVALPLFNFGVTTLYDIMGLNIIGATSYYVDIPMPDLVKSPDDLVFAKLSQGIRFVWGCPQIWSFMLYSSYFLMGMRNLIMMKFIILQTIYYTYPGLIGRQMLCSAVSGLVTFVIGVASVTPLAKTFIEVMRILLGKSTLLLSNLQILGLMWSYGLANFVDDVHFMMGIKPSLFWRISWFTTPFFFLCIQVASIIQYFRKMEKYAFGYKILGHFILSLPIIMTIGYAIVYRLQNKTEKLRHLFRPALDWGPTDERLWKSRQMFAAHSITKEYTYRQSIIKDRFKEDDDDELDID